MQLSVALILLPLVVGTNAPRAAESKQRPNFVVVLIDDWALSDWDANLADGNSWNDLVHIGSLAERGLTWRNFYSQPSCQPTRASLMFGQYTHTQRGVVCSAPTEETPAADVPTVAKMLRAAGYATAAFGKWHIAGNPDPEGRWEDAPGAYGFDAWRAWNGSNIGAHCGSKDYKNWYRIDDGVGKQTNECHSAAVGRATRDWWNETEGPKFAYVCFQAPHVPLHTPPEWMLPDGYPAPSTKREAFESMLVALDTGLGILLGAIDPTNTYVLLMGDNGTAGTSLRADQDRERSKSTTFEDGINVPFFVAGPAIEPGTTQALGHVVDVMATLAELASAEIASSEAIDSVSLVPVFRNPNVQVRDHVVCDLEKRAHEKRSRDTAVIASMSAPPRLVKGRWFHDEATGERTTDFYDLTVDPNESSPVTRDPDYAANIARVKAFYEAYSKR